jgi:hypothetical protein
MSTLAPASRSALQAGAEPRFAATARAVVPSTSRVSLTPSVHPILTSHHLVDEPDRAVCCSSVQGVCYVVVAHATQNVKQRAASHVAMRWRLAHCRHPLLCMTVGAIERWRCLLLQLHLLASSLVWPCPLFESRSRSVTSSTATAANVAARSLVSAWCSLATASAGMRRAFSAAQPLCAIADALVIL